MCPNSPSPPSRRSTIFFDWRYRSGLLLVVLLCLCWGGRSRLLQVVPAILITQSSATPLNVVVVVDGADAYHTAAQLLRSNPDAELWIFDRRPNRLQRRGILPSSLECTLATCEKGQIPSERIHVFPTSITSTRKLLDQLDVRVRQSPRMTVGLLTDEWNSRWLSGQVKYRINGGTNRVCVVPLPSTDVARSEWWVSKSGRRRVTEAAFRLAMDWLIRDQDLPPEEVSDKLLREAATVW